MAVPTLIQHVSSTTNPIGVTDASGTAVASAVYKFTIPNAVGLANCLILEMSWPDGITLSSIADSNGNTWPAASESVGTGSGNVVTEIFVLPNAKAGITTLTINLSATTYSFKYKISEFNNIATSFPVVATAGQANQTNAGLGAGINCSALTPGTGNLVYAAFEASNYANGNPSSFSPGTVTGGVFTAGSFIMLDGDIGWRNGNGVPSSSQYFVQTSSSAITPAVIPNGDTGNSYNCVAVALTSAAAGTPKPTGIHIDRICHFSSDTTPVTGIWKFQIPSTGNLRVILSTEPDSGASFSQIVTGMLDSDGNNWVRVAPDSSVCQFWYAKNTTPNTNTTLTLTYSGSSGNNTSWRYYDISGADPNPLDSGATAFVDPISIGAVSSISNQPTITPTTSHGVVIATMGLNFGPGLAVTSPANATFNLCTYTGENDADCMENADADAHFYYTNLPGTLNFNWTITPIGGNAARSTAVAFKAAPASGTSVNLTFGILGLGASEW